MQIIETSLPGVLLIEPRVFADDRGFFYESFNEKAFRDASGIQQAFVQDNHSFSRHGVLRGLHYQIEHAQGKLVRAVTGEVFDAVVDMRRSSRTFGQWAGFVLSADNHRMLWVPPGFAHGYYVLSDAADFLYKTTDYWFPQHERCLLWNDPQVAVGWPLVDGTPLLSPKDLQGLPFAQAACYP